MRTIIYALLLTLTIGCTSEKTMEGTLVGIAEGIELTLPDGFQYRALQGIDSNVGEIVDTNDDNFHIFIDIGFLAGSYVNQDDNNVHSGRSINQDYIYQKRESGYLDVENCCYFFTFLDIGPANFVVPDNDRLDDAIAIIESLDSNP